MRLHPAPDPTWAGDQRCCRPPGASAEGACQLGLIYQAPHALILRSLTTGMTPATLLVTYCWWQARAEMAQVAMSLKLMAAAALSAAHCGWYEGTAGSGGAINIH
jgi:hypothetical protein